MATLGDLVVRIVGDNSQLDSSINSSQQRMQQFSNSMRQIGRGLTTFVTLPILGIGAAAVKSAADLELQAAAFETMLGSAERAQQLLQDLTDMAARTPFQMTDLADATKTLLAFGISAEDVLPTLSQLGDISLGDSQRLGQLALVFGQVQSAGRLMGQDLLQLINVGFNPLQTISEQTGETMAELKTRMEQGQISAEEVAEAIRIATSEGGLFFGGMERASQTLAGRFSTLKDNVAALGRSFAEELMPVLENIIEGAMNLVEWFSSLDSEARKSILTFAAVAAAAGPVVLAINAIRGAFAALATPPTGAIVLTIAALGLLITHLINVRRRSKEYEDQLYNTANAVAEMNEEEKAQLNIRFNQDLLETYRERRTILREIQAVQEEIADIEAAEDLGGQLDYLQSVGLAQAEQRLQALGTELEDNTTRINTFTTALTELAQAGIETANNIERAATELGDTTDDTLKDAAENAAALKEQLAELAAQARDEQEQKLANTLEELAAAEEAAAEALEAKLVPAMLELKEAGIAEAALQAQKYVDELKRVKDAANEQADAMLAAQEFLAENTRAFDEARLEERRENAELQLGIDRARIEEEIANEEKLAQKRRDLTDEAIAMAQGFSRAIGDLASNRADAEIAAIEESELAEEEKAERIRAIKRRQAEDSRKVAAFNVFVDTAQAIIKFLANPGGWAGVALSAVAGATGIAQLAAINAAPLPALASGGIVTRPTTAVVGEGGQPEVIFPLDQLASFLRDRPDMDGGSSMQHVVVNLDGAPILDHIFRASQDRRLLIDARAVV